MRVIAIDPGERNIGVAISDPTGTIANPLTVIAHVSRLVDAATIAHTAEDQGAGLIIVGQALDAEDRPTFQSRKSARLAKAIQTQTEIPVVLWDETGSTQAARAAAVHMDVSRSKRKGHHDELAATYILQTYLDANPSRGN